MDTFLFLSFVFLIVVISIIIPYTSNIQTTTLWFSKNFLPLVLARYPHSYDVKKLQAFVTPKSQSIRQIAIPVILIGLFINCLYIHWYYILIAALVIFILSMLLGAIFYKRALSYYLLILYNELRIKTSTPEYQNNLEKAGFIEDLLIMLKHAHEKAVDENIDLTKL